jgi:hypothetical protein
LVVLMVLMLVRLLLVIEEMFMADLSFKQTFVKMRHIVGMQVA